jgi:hypothetical protein
MFRHGEIPTHTMTMAEPPPTARAPTAPPLTAHPTTPFATVDCPSGQSYVVETGHLATEGDIEHYHAVVPRDARLEHGMLVTTVAEEIRKVSFVVSDPRARPRSGTAPPVRASPRPPPPSTRQIGAFL